MQHPSGKQPQTNWQWRELDKQFRLQSRQVHDIVLQRGEGCHVWDVEGKEYLDLMSGQPCVSVGHSSAVRWTPKFGQEAKRESRS